MQPCLCGYVTGSHNDDAIEASSQLCAQCLEAGCDPENEEAGCLVEEDDEEDEPAHKIIGICPACSTDTFQGCTKL